MDGIVLRLATALPGFLLGIVFHEWAHAWTAKKFGDDTAERMGRLSMNPIVHYDLVGTIIFPIVGLAMGGMMFGWAKPVPVDPRRFKNMNKGIFWVSFAGPIANIILAILSSFLLAILYTQVNTDFGFNSVVLQMLQSSIYINLILAVFNLIPFPPLDGSKMVSTFLDYDQARKYEDLQRFTFLFIILIWMTPVLSYIMTPALMMGNGMTSLFIGLLG
jgi:Zn-dependent protease